MGEEIAKVPLLDGMLDFEASVELGQRFSCWGAKLDTWMCAKHGIAKHARRRYCGRLDMPKLVVRPVVRRNKHDHNDVDEWSTAALWACLEARVKEVATAIAGGHPHGPGQQRSWKCGANLLRRVWAQAGEAEHVLDKTRVILVLLRLEQVSRLGLEIILLLAEDLSVLRKAAEWASRAAVSRKVNAWATKALLERGAGQACRWIKPPSVVCDGVVDKANGGVVYGPMECADARARTWGKQWTAARRVDYALPVLLRELRAEALRDARGLEAISSGMVRSAVSAIKA
eukprot:16436373-Heterocapsa_arctica.AAC.1